jgi:cystathionine gamma-synthase
VRAGIDRDTAYGAVTPPLVLSSNFSFAGFGEKRQYDYTRSGNPTRDLLGEALAELEGGAGGVVTATGMGAITLVLNALLQPGDRWWCRTMLRRQLAPVQRAGEEGCISN